MRVLQVMARAWRAGGDSEHALALTDQLRQLGLEVEVFATADTRNVPARYQALFPEFCDFNAALYSRDLRKLRSAVAAALYSPRARAGLRAVMRDFRPDIVHVHVLHQYFTLSCALELKRFGAPVVYTAHDYKLICGNTNCFNDRSRAICTRCLGGRWWEPLRQRCKKGSTVASAATVVQTLSWKLFKGNDVFAKIHAPSAFVASLLKGEPELADRVLMLRSPLVPLVQDPERTPASEPRVVFAGRLEYLKGVLTLAHAVREIRAPVVICGSGPAEASMREVLCDRPDTHWMGWLSREQLADVMVPGVIVAVPSECFETLGMAAGQAMQRGCCVVASEIGAVAELITHMVDGVLVPPGNPIVLRDTLTRLLAAPDLVRQIGTAAKRRMRDWPTQEEHARAMLEVYRQMLAHRDEVAVAKQDLLA